MAVPASTNPAGLTRAEARARAGLLSVDRYAVHLDLRDLDRSATFRSASTIDFSCRRPGETTFVELAAADVDLVELNGRALDPATVVHGDRIQLPALAAQNRLTVRATHTDADSRTGLHRAIDAEDQAVYVWTTFEPYDAHSVFACFDQPDLKASFEFSVRVPDGWLCVSNGRGTANGPEWTFAPTPPLSSYVTVVCAGPFHQVRRQHGAIDLGLFCRASLADRLDEDELFEVTAQGLDYFGAEFALPFPLDKYDQVFLLDFPGAMENFGCVTWTDQEIFRSEPTAAQLESRAIVLLHEMAHMWFGDIVTMRWWEDLWLNESFADWAAVWAAAAATRYADAWATFTQLRKERGYAADQSAATTHPVRRDVPDIATTTASFDMITYAKGASLLKQLVARVGEEAFVRGLRSYFARYAWSNVDLSGLLEELQAATDADVRAWSAQWLETAGLTTLELVTTVESGAYTDVTVRQRAPEGVAPRPHRLVLSAYDRSPDGALHRREQHLLAVDGEYTPVSALAGAPAADVLLLNDEDLTFAKVRLDPSSTRTLLEAGWRLPTAVSRAVARVALWHLVEDALLPARMFVRFAAESLGHEAHGAELEALLEQAVTAAALWSGDAERDALLAEVADACLAIARRNEPGRRLVALRGLTAAATTEEQLAVLGDVVHGDAFGADADLRWRALTRLAAFGRSAAADIARVGAADPDPDRAGRTLAVRAAEPDQAAKQETWQALVLDRTVPWHVVGEVASAFWQPHQAAVLSAYPERYIEALGSIGTSEQWMIAAAIARIAFPYVAVDEDFVQRVTDAATAPTVPPHVSHEVLARADALARMLRARAASQGASR